MNYANSTAGWQSIVLPQGYLISLTSPLPALTDDAGVDIVGHGAIVDGGTSNDCLQVSSSNTLLLNLEIRDCSDPLVIDYGVASCQFSRLYIHDNGQHVQLDGVDPIFGPCNTVSGSTDGGLVAYRTCTIEWNAFHDNAGRGIDLTMGTEGSLIIGNVVTGSDPGIFAFGDDLTFVHNTLHGNTTNGFGFGSSSGNGSEGLGCRSRGRVRGYRDHRRCG